MKWGLQFLLGAGVIAAGIWFYQYWFPAEETVIRNRLHDLAETVSFNSEDGTLARLAQANALRQFFTEDVGISVYGQRDRSYRWQGRDELVQAAMAARSQVAALQVEFLDIQVELRPDEASASAYLTAKAEVAGERGIQVQELRMGLSKIEGDWKIRQVETIETLKK